MNFGSGGSSKKWVKLLTETISLEHAADVRVQLHDVAAVQSGELVEHRSESSSRRATHGMRRRLPVEQTDQRAKIGKRGLRLDETKPGSGLGLSIVSDLVQSYGGSMQLAASTRGGLKVELELPAV